MTLKLREYQKEVSGKGSKVLTRYGIVYLSMQVRTGKSATALEICKLNGYKKVLFLTKKRAIPSIESDYDLFGYKYYFALTVANNESMHKVVGSFDVVIHDESHRFGSYPKPSEGAKQFKKMFGHLPMILLSGTPTPESYSQIYHQLWVSDKNPFKQWSSFYKWAKDFVDVTDRNLGYAVVKDYLNAYIEKITPYIEPLMLSFTQEEAGFSTTIKENILYCPIKENTLKLIRRLERDKVIEGKDEIILADTAVKLMQKVHQMYSGTVKFESGNSKVLDLSKATFINQYFRGRKVAIFYKFKAELEAIKEVYKDSITTDLEEFNNSDKSIALQIVSGREGISLKKADYLIYYNIDFSATSYFQSRDRLTTMDRLTNDIYWIFTRGGIEEKIYKAVQSKRDYTLQYYKRDFL